MAGYSYSSPVTPNNSNKRQLHNSNSCRRTPFLPRESMKRNSSLRGSSSKVIKTKSRLSNSTYKNPDRQMFLKKYVEGQMNPPNRQNHHVSKTSNYYPRENNDYSHEASHLFNRRERNTSLGLLTLVQSKGLTAFHSTSPFKPANLPSTFSTPKINGFLYEDKMNNLNKNDLHQSKVHSIQENWKLPKESNIFKQSLENYNSTKPASDIYPDKSGELIITNHVNGIRESQLVDKFNSLDVHKSNTKSVTERLKDFFSKGLRIPYFTFRHTLRQFIPFRLEDHEVSERAEVEREEKLAPFTQEMEDELVNLFRSPNVLICTEFSINIHTNDLITLTGSKWLNDSVIEFYLNLIALRSKSPNYPSVYTFGTFFYTRLSKGNSLGRWANKLDFFSYEILLVPIHSASHWRLAIVDNVEKCIAYYDSLGGKYRKCIDDLSNFLQTESLNKKNQALDMSKWTLKYDIPDQLPQQNNSYDCGVFTCKYADYLARRKPITFSQENIPYFRQCMIWEIVHKKLLN